MPSRIVSPSTPKPIQQLGWAQDAQRDAFNAGPYPVCGSGGFGSSKTWAFCLKALWLSETFPGNRGLIFRRIGDELRKTTRETFFKICPASAYQPHGRRSDHEGILKFNNGSEILWMHMDNSDVETVLRGLEINWFFGDQAEEIDEGIFDILMARLGRWDMATVPQWMIDQQTALGREWAFKHPESGKPIPPIYPMIAVNPETDLHWVYRRFHPDSPEWRETYKAQGYRMIFFHTLQNRFLPEHNKQNMLAQGKSFVARYVLGEWGLPEGRIHVVPPEAQIEFDDAIQAEAFVDHLRRTCLLYRTLDHGDTAPTCVLWWAVDQAGNSFCYREYYQPDKLVSYHREQVAALSAGESYTWNQADPSIFSKMQQKHGGRWCTADEWSDTVHLPAANAVIWHPADNNELGTRNRISEYLAVDPERNHPVTKERGAPRLFFVKRSDAYPQGCDRAIRETRAQKRKQIGTEGGVPMFCDERDDTIADHAYDCTRYFLASRAPIAREPRKVAAPGTFYGKQRELAKLFAKQRRGR